MAGGGSVTFRHKLKRHKFGVSPADERTRDGRVFDSKAEARRYDLLMLAYREGRITYPMLQPRFQLPGHADYKADFMFCVLANFDRYEEGDIAIEDVKGHRTQAYKTKKRAVEKRYAPLAITEIPA